MESLIDFNILKDSHLFRKMEPLEKGWSNDRKYIIWYDALSQGTERRHT